MVYPKYRPNQTCDYCLITQNQQILFIETNNSGQLQNNTVNGAVSITINRVFNCLIFSLLHVTVKANKRYKCKLQY